MAKASVNKMKQTDIKTELRSAFHTFLSAFILTIVPYITDIDWRTIEQSALISIALAGVRAGIKAISMYFFPKE